MKTPFFGMSGSILAWGLSFWMPFRQPAKVSLLSVLMMLPVMFMPRSNTAQAPAISEDTGYLDVSREHVAWPSPESLVSDLHSKDGAVRLSALHLLGLSDERAHMTIWSQTSPSKAIGEAVVTPDQIELQYASLGEDSTQHAVLALQISQRQDTSLWRSLFRFVRQWRLAPRSRNISSSFCGLAAEGLASTLRTRGISEFLMVSYGE